MVDTKSCTHDGQKVPRHGHETTMVACMIMMGTESTYVWRARRDHSPPMLSPNQSSTPMFRSNPNHET